MRKHLTLLAAATLAAGSFAFLTNGLYADEGVGDRAKDAVKDRIGNIDVKTEGTHGLTSAQLPKGTQKASKDDSEDIRDTLATATEASLTKNGFNDLVERFVDADRNRIGVWMKDHKDWTAFNNRVNQIRTDWKAKYGKDFDIDHKIAFGQEFKNFTIVQGEIVDPMLMSNWPVEQPVGTNAKDSPKQNKGDIDTGAGKVNIGELGKASNKPSDRNLDKGRNIAVVGFPASHGMPDVFVSMIHEMPDRWKIDVPDNIGGQELYDNLMKHLDALGNSKDWPADFTDAQRMAAHHVLMGVYGVAMPTTVLPPPADMR